MKEHKIDRLNYIKTLLKIYNIDVDKSYYLLDYNYEPSGALYILSSSLNSRNQTLYIKVTDELEVLNIFREYLNLTNSDFIRLRTK